MKYIATILILFICLSGYGQQLSPPITLNGREWTPTQYDTVKVLMLVCDTSRKDGFYEMFIFKNGRDSSQNVGETYNHVPYVYWQYGYVAYKKFTGETSSVKIDCIDYIEENIKCDCHRTYLDADKQPLKKSIIVWQSLIIK